MLRRHLCIEMASGLHNFKSSTRPNVGIRCCNCWISHYTEVIMGTIASQITSLTIVYSTVYADADQRKHQSSASLAFVWGIHRRPANSPHKWPVTRKMFPFDDVIMYWFIQKRQLQSPWLPRSPLPKCDPLHQLSGISNHLMNHQTISITKPVCKR